MRVVDLLNQLVNLSTGGMIRPGVDPEAKLRVHVIFPDGRAEEGPVSQVLQGKDGTLTIIAPLTEVAP